MGRLYDKQDLQWNLAFWDRKEQELHADIANGRVPASILNKWIIERRDHQGPCGRSCGCKQYRLRDGFDLERKRERMKLLRTGTLLRELDRWRRMFQSCEHCYQTKMKNGKTRDVACDAHNEGLSTAKSAVFWAGQHNVDERNSRGQRRAQDRTPEGLPTAQEALEGLEGPPIEEKQLTDLEKQYYQDRSNGSWTPQIASSPYDVEYSYKGWLHMLLQNEELTQEQYVTELGRIKAQQEELERTSLQWAGANTKQGTKKGRERFQRDTRFNQTLI